MNPLFLLCSPRKFIGLIGMTLLLCLVTWSVTRLSADPVPPPIPLELTIEAQKAIDAYPHDPKASGPKLRVVYFTPADAEPQADHQARVTRILQHINDFLHTEMKRNGLRCEGLPLEMEGDLLKLHEVKGKLKVAEYRHESGDQTEREMREALKGKVDFDQEFVLALYSMCTKKPDGSYFFYAPYYGKAGSNQRSGLCHAADCELLDPPLLKETGRQINYEEHYGTFRKTLADFNTAYLGGIAHELGHGLGLPHDCQTPAELPTRGNSLMGGGNLTYGREVWKPGAGQGSFLTIATSLRLASHPLLTGGTSDRMKVPRAEFAELNFTTQPKAMHLQGKLQTDIPCYAAVAYIDPASRPSDYDAVPYVGLVTEGKFEIDAVIPAPGAYSMRVSALHLNGAVTTKRFQFSASAKDVLVDAEKLNHYSEQDDPRVIAEFINPRSQATAAAMLLEIEKSPEEKVKLKSLTEALAAKPLPVLDPSSVTESTLWLSDAKWNNASVGWGLPARNIMGAPSEITGPFIRLGNAYFLKGLYAHSPSRYSFQLAKKWTTFTAVIGVKSGDALQRNATFVINGDGRELYRSKLLNSLSQENVKVDVTDVATLELIVEKGTGPNGHSWSVWGSPQVSR